MELMAFKTKEHARLGEMVRAMRIEKGWNQTKLAERAGMGQSQISDLENGENDPQLSTLVRIAKALGKPLEIFFRADAAHA